MDRKDASNRQEKMAVFWAFLAAALYTLNAPISKLLLKGVGPTMMAGFLYLGAGVGMFLLGLVRPKLGWGKSEQRLIKKDLPYVLGMILLDIVAPICLMIGLATTTAANVSLLNNFEIVATSLIALFIFHEKINQRLWLAIGLITLSSFMLSWEDPSAMKFSTGSLFVLLACICWGFENNCTRMISRSDPLEIVVLKGFGSGIGSLIIAMTMGEILPPLPLIGLSLLLGFVSYGLSIFCYVYAQRYLGAAKTSAYYAISPFLGVGLSLVIFQERPTPLFWIALIVMIAGTYFLAFPKEKVRQ